MVGVRLWLCGALASLGVLGSAYGDPVPCPHRAAARGWIRGTVTSLEPATFACRPTPGVATDPQSRGGCVVGAIDPWCDHKPHNVTVSLDGSPREVSYPSTGAWRVCDLAPGHHVLTVCSSEGDFRCAADVSASTPITVQMTEVEPRVSVRATEVYVGTPSMVGRDFTFTLGNAQHAKDLRLPSQITLAWTEDGELPHAYLCEPPRSPAPGCGRCDAGSPSGAALLFAVLAIVIGRRR